jgi:hypothetical protein
VKRPRASLDQKLPYRNFMAVVGGLTAVCVLIAAVYNIPGLKNLIFGEESSAPNVEILFDRSERMGDRLGQESVTKLQAAVAAFKGLSFGGDRLALRLFGGTCNQEPSQPDIGFRADQKDKLASKLDGLTPKGNAGLASAVLAAIGDFNAAEKFKGSRRIVVITAGADSCQGAPLDEIRQAIRSQSRGVQLDFHFFGLALTDREKEKLEEIRKATDGNPVVFVNNREELEAGLTKVLVFKPVEESTTAMLDILNRCTDRLNALQIEADTADADLRSARDEFTGSNAAFDDLGKRQSRSEFKSLYKLAAELRDIQQRMFTDMEKLIAKNKAKDIEGFNAAVKEFKDHGNAYNAKVSELNSALRQMRVSALWSNQRRSI